MTISLLSLPTEIRLNIYHHLFAPSVALIEEGVQGHKPSFISGKAVVRPSIQCSGQVLRVCQTIKEEATPILYGRIQFCVLTQAFAGQLPLSFSKDAPFALRIQHLTWQLSCDMMKHFYKEDFAVTPGDLVQLKSLELRSQAESWKGSFCGEWVDHQAFVRGREQMVNYAQQLQCFMREGSATEVFLVEDRKGLKRGRVVLKLTRGRPVISGNDFLVE